MKEKIEVGYTPAAVVGFAGIYHKYILYTNSNGEQFYARGGPESRTETSPAPFPFGNIKTEYGEYKQGTPDWDNARGGDPNATPHPRETIIEGDDLSPQWEKIKDRMKEIGDSKIDYEFEDSNSNAVVDEALREAGLPTPQMDGPSDYWSPGSDFDLPGGNVPAADTGRDFLKDFREWVSEKVGWDKFLDQLEKDILDGLLDLSKNLSDFGKNIKDWWDRAKSWTWPRDPIILDLDGDGLETVGLASNVYFDHDGDGVLTKSGWAGKDDALLVWDRNANGTIDTGAELFGDFTVLPDGTLAPNGFAALAALDANGDGVIDASDPAFHELKLWRDTSQDGQTGSGELISLADAGIVSLNLAHTLKNQNLANGNQLTREGSFTRTDGTTSAMGEFNLATDTFNTKFAEQIEVPEALKTLPNMQGAGNVRELRQAATQSDGVASLLAQFQNAATRAEQKALIDQLLTAWADTSGMAKNLDARAQGQYIIQYEAFGNDRRSDHIDSVGFVAAQTAGPLTFEGMTGALSTDIGASYLSAHYRELIDSWNQKLHALEAFNGQYFFNLPTQKSQTSNANWGMTVTTTPGSTQNSGGIAMTYSVPTLKLNFSTAQLDLLQQAYDSLKESVYASLVMQTRLKPYLDQIELVIDNDGIWLDAAALNQKLAEKKATDPENYLADLLDLDRYAGAFLAGTNWQGLADFDTLIDSLPNTPAIQALLDEFKVRRLTDTDESQWLGDDADIVLAGEGISWQRQHSGCGNDAIWRVAA